MKKNSMKKIVYLCCIAALLMITSLAKAQLPPDTVQWHISELSSPDAVFPMVQQRANAYFDAHPEMDTINPLDKLAYKRWEYFWRSRANINGASQPGKLTDVLNAMNNSSQLSFQQDLATITLDSKWKLLSPKSMESQNMGTVTAIWANPNDENIILIGTETSGLWKTTDGGYHWINITDSYAMANTTYVTASGFGVSSIAVNPANFNEIYIATYLPNTELIWGHGANILKSTDGGASWNPLSSYTAFITPTNTYYKNMVWKIVFDNNNIYAAIGKKLVAFNPAAGSTQYSVIFELGVNSYNSLNPAQVSSSDLYPYTIYRKIRDFELISTNDDADRKICLTTDGLTNVNGTYIQAEIYHTLHSKDPFAATPYTWIRKDLPLLYSNGFIDNAAVAVYDNTFYIAYDEKNHLNPITGSMAYFNIDILNTTSNTLTNIFTHTHYLYESYPETISTQFDVLFNGFGYRYDVFEIADVNTMYVGGFDIYKIDFSQTPAVASSLTYYGQAAAANHLTYENFNKNNYCHNGIRTIKIFNNVNSNFLVGNEGGISKYTGNFANINGNGLAITQFTNITATQRNQRDVIVAGSLRNGLWHYENRWRQFYWEDGGNSLMIDNNPDIIFNCVHWWDASSPGFNAHLYTGGIFSRTYTGLSHVICSVGNHNAYVCPSLSYASEPAGISSYFPPLEYRLNPVNNPILYLGKHDVLESSDNGTNWTNISNITQDYWARELQAIKIAPSNPTIMYIAYANPTWGLDASGTSPAATPGKKLFKGDKVGLVWQWTDITTNVYLTPTEYTLVYNGISDIAINPSNANEIWITLNQFCSYNAQNGKERVMHSTDGGATFTEYSQGLSPAPVNCIKYYNNNGNRLLFIGTDVGVFYRDPTDNSTSATWKPLNSSINPLPRCIVSDMEISYATNKLRIATLGRGIWETEIFCMNTPQQSLIISQDETWNTDNYIGGIYIQPEKTLTITSNIRFIPNANIIIASGAKLILDGGTLEACPGEMWDGVRIYGNNTINQSDATAHGTITILNNGTIKDALIGIKTCDEIYNDKGAGIIQIYDATFLNNQKAIVMNKYQNPDNEWEQSFLQNCKFITDDIYHDVANYPFQHFVELHDIYKLNILGCTFENNIPVGITNNWAAAGKGIVSTNAVFTVNTKCNDPNTTTSGTPCPAQYTAKSEFRNLQYGIYATSDNVIKNFTVKNSMFDNNFRGIHAMTINNAVFTNNTFKVIDFAYGGNGVLFPAAYGLYLNNCSGYTVEGNHFDKSDSYPYASLGLVVHNSGNAINTVYNNTFTNIKYAATQAQDNNRGTDYNNGLKIKCNDYILNRQDVAVLAYSSSDITGISLWQGRNNGNDQTAPAGNTFSKDGRRTLTDYNNTQGQNISYYHHNGTIANPWVPQYCNASPKITKIPTTASYSTKAQVCPSIAVTNDGQLPTLAQISQLLSQSTLNYNSAKLILQIWVDGGNTEGLIQTVELAYPWEAYELYDNLLGNSPYLSDDVLIEAIQNEEVLPPLMLKLILLANPQAVRSDRVMQALYNRNNPFPEEWIEELMQGLEVISPRENLEADVAHYATERKTYLDLLKKYYLDDDSETAPQSLLQLLSEETDIDSRYELAFAQLANNDAETANITLDNIAQILPEDEAVIEKYNQLRQVFPIIGKIETEGKTWEELEAEERALIINFSENNNELPGMLAKSIRLRFDSQYIYEEPIYVVEDQDLRTATENKTNNKWNAIANESFSISPNPAKEFIILSYAFNGNTNGLQLLISNALGKKVYSKALSKAKDELLITLKGYATGNYIATIFNGGKAVKSSKFVVE